MDIHGTIVGGSNRLGGEYGLIEVDYAVVLVFQVINLFQHIQSPFIIFLQFHFIYLLYDFNLLPSNLIDFVELSEESRIDAMVWELPVKQDAPLLKRFAGPFEKRLRVLEEINMWLPQETHPISSANRYLLFLLDLFPRFYPIIFYLIEVII